jgi:integrase
MKSFGEIGVTGISVLDTRREKKSGKFPVKFRITFQRKSVFYRANIDLTTDEWLSVTDPKHKNHNTLFAKRMRKQIDAGIESIQENVRSINEIQGFTFDKLDKRMGKVSKSELLNTFDQLINDNIEKGKYNTSDWYKYSKKSIEKYSAGSTLKFKNIDTKWLDDFEQHLLKEGKSITTISMYLRALQAVINKGISDCYIKQSDYPFGKNKYRIPKEAPRKTALNLGQIKKILDYDPMTPNETFLRDIWIFSYLCNGINIVDLLKLQYSNIKGREITFSRQKTIRKIDKTKVRAIILPEMSQIIEKWGNEKKADNYIFPILRHDLSPKQELLMTKNFTSLLNKKMHRIGKLLDIGSITSYTARHSFATITKRSGASIEYISESLGHSDSKTTQSYLAEFEIETRIKNAENLLNFNKDETK